MPEQPSPQVVILPRGRRGRPPAREPRSTVSTWIAVSDHDLLIQTAQKHHMSVSRFVRCLLLHQLRRDPPRGA